MATASSVASCVHSPPWQGQDIQIYRGRSMAAPMVRVSCLGFRILCARQGADAVFTEELVSFKLKRCVREVVRYPIPLRLLPVGYQLLASDVLAAINNKPLTAEGSGLTVGKSSVPITSIYKIAPEDAQINLLIGDAMCGPSQLIHSILPNGHLSQALASFQKHFNVKHDTALSAESIVAFLDQADNIDFLPADAIVAHVPVVEIIQYESFKKGYRRALASSFLQKSPLNPFPEGDRRSSGERLASAVLPRLNNPKCVQVIGQLGTSNPVDAALGAAIIGADVDGLDVNMGCPKAFSVQNGMGAALMKQPALAGQILKAIHHSLNTRASMRRRMDDWGAASEDANGFIIPLSFKTRIYGTTEDSVHHLSTVIGNCIRHKKDKRLRSDADGGEPDDIAESATTEEDIHPNVLCPLHGLSLHARTREQRSESAPLRDEAAAIITALRSVTHLRVSVADDGAETFTPISTEAEGDLSHSLIPLASHLQGMSFVFNGSLADNSLICIPPPFDGALVARHCMWDMSVFNNNQFVTKHEFATAHKCPVPIAMPTHLPFHELLGWALPPPAGRNPADWLDIRRKVTDSERYSARQMAVVYLDLLRHFAAYKNHSMYAKYHFTRSFGEFPLSKLTCYELEFLLGSTNCEADAVGQSALAISKITGKLRGDSIFFTTIQACSTWFEFYVALKRLELCQWGISTSAPSDEFLLAEMTTADRFIFAITPRGDEVFSEIPCVGNR